MHFSFHQMIQGLNSKLPSKLYTTVCDEYEMVLLGKTIGLEGTKGRRLTFIHTTKKSIVFTEKRT